MQNHESNTADRELSISRLFDAPIHLMWEVWTDPDHVKNWWGPDGFTNTITKMNVTPGGEWDLVMHAPDGTDHTYKCFFKEVSKNKRLVYEHLAWPKFIATVDFESRAGKTFIRWQMLFESKEVLAEFVETHKADEGIKQNIEKLANYLINTFNY